MSPTTKRVLRIIIYVTLYLLLTMVFTKTAGQQINQNDKLGGKPGGEVKQRAKKETKKLDPKDDPDQIGNRDISKGVNLYSLEKEIAIGKGLAVDVEKSAKIVEDPVIAEYVNRVGQNLVRNSDAKVPFTVKVIDAEEINAFALPGGFLFVNRGLLDFAEDESEIAGVMAHEIAHVAARHGTRQASRGTIANLATIPLIFMGGWAGYGIQQAANVAIPVTFLKFSRAFEEEADILGIQYLYKSGYEPLAFINFFEKIQAQEKKKPGTVSKIFSSHPTTDNRIKLAQKYIDGALKPQSQYVITTSEFNEVKKRIQTLTGRRKLKDEKTGPTLRRTPSGKIEPGEEGKEKKEEDERPTLK
ncbi:MAG: M48 family metallopeptidase, partial [Patescibacteria group bacterium]